MSYSLHPHPHAHLPSFHFRSIWQRRLHVPVVHTTVAAMHAKSDRKRKFDWGLTPNSWGRQGNRLLRFRFSLTACSAVLQRARVFPVEKYTKCGGIRGLFANPGIILLLVLVIWAVPIVTMCSSGLRGDTRHSWRFSSMDCLSSSGISARDKSLDNTFICPESHKSKRRATVWVFISC